MRFSLLSLLLSLSAAVSVYAATATTTRYYDGQKGACGCGTDSGAFGWTNGISTNVYTAAASQAIYDSAGKSWCGAGCGLCFNLTNTGKPACQTCGTGAGAGQSIIVMVTNLCPYNGNQQWCPNPGSTNQYGYSAHFDIQTSSSFGWDNPVVNYNQVTCPTVAKTDYSQCQCAAT